MADAVFVVKVADRVFKLADFTFGDWYMLKDSFGLDADDIYEELPEGQRLRLEDPRVLIALMVAALSHERPNGSIADLKAEILALKINGLEFPDDEPEAEPDPTPAGNGTDESAPAKKSGTPAKTRKGSGKQT